MRAGDKSFHPNWLQNEGAGRLWDMHISYYGAEADPYPDRPADVTVTREQGTKFPGLAECLRKLGPRLDRYAYIGLPDDDLIADCRIWNRAFEIMLKYRPALAQPALDRRSFYAYPILLQRPKYILRWTNFVELMTPIFSRQALAEALPDFERSKSGWGMDYYWAHLFDAPKHTMAILDGAPVLHTRDNGIGPLYKLIDATGGATPEEDFTRYLEEKGVPRHAPQVFAAVDRAGRLSTFPRGADRRLFLPRVRQGLRRKLSIRQIERPASSLSTS